MLQDGLTPKQQQVLEFIRQWLATYPYAPTVREIMRGLGYTTPSIVYFHLCALEKEGVIGREYAIARGLWLIEGRCGTALSTTGTVPLLTPLAEGV